MSPTFDSLRHMMPLAPSAWITALTTFKADRWRINSPYRWAAFLGQLAHETGQFQRLEENLNYSAERLMAVWPKRFPNLEATTGYARSPETLANKVYASRMGNGNETTGDGWRFRGRGPIQITGRDNYSAASAATGLDLLRMPQRVFEPAVGMDVAGWYWDSHGLNELADVEDHKEISRKINGGSIGLEDRLAWIDKARAALLTARTGL